MQKCASVAIWWSLMHISFVLDKKLDQTQIFALNCLTQWRLLVKDTVHIRATHNQQFDDVTLITLYMSIKI